MNQNSDSRSSEAETKTFSEHTRDSALPGVFDLVLHSGVEDTKEENGSYVYARRMKQWQSGSIRAIIEMDKLRPSEDDSKCFA